MKRNTFPFIFLFSFLFLFFLPIFIFIIFFSHLFKAIFTIDWSYSIWFKRNLCFFTTPGTNCIVQISLIFLNNFPSPLTNFLFYFFSWSSVSFFRMFNNFFTISFFWSFNWRKSFSRKRSCGYSIYHQPKINIILS